jgi:hypothetical protein
MKNKELALKKMDQLSGALVNFKTSAYRGANDLSERYDRVMELMDELHNLIQIEEDTLLNRGYKGI